jgi:hypothetical protein
MIGLTLSQSIALLAASIPLAVFIHRLMPARLPSSLLTRLEAIENKLENMSGWMSSIEDRVTYLEQKKMEGK